MLSKKRIDLLDADIKEKKEQIRNLERENKFLKFLVENPPHFKKGDMFGELKITEYRSDNLRKSVENHLALKDLVTLFAGIGIYVLDKGQNKDAIKSVISKKIVSQWAYELTNVVTGEKVLMNEYELLLMDKPQK